MSEIMKIENYANREEAINLTKGLYGKGFVFDYDKKREAFEKAEPNNAFLYRIVDGLNEDCTTINLLKYNIIRKTPCGFWIKPFCQSEKYVSAFASATFAYLDINEAFNSYIQRKLRQRKILTNQLNKCNAMIEKLQTERPLDPFNDIVRIAPNPFEYKRDI